MGMAAYSLGRLHMRDGEYALAEPLLRKSVEQKGDRAPRYAALGEALRAQGKTEAALAAYQAGLATKPTSQVLTLGLASCHMDLGQPEEAVKVLRAALRKSRWGMLLHKRLGDVFVKTGAYGQAVEEYRAAVIGAPEFAQKHPQLLALLDDDGDPETIARKAETYLAETAKTQRESGGMRERLQTRLRNRQQRAFQVTGA